MTDERQKIDKLKKVVDEMKLQYSLGKLEARDGKERLVTEVEERFRAVQEMSASMAEASGDALETTKKNASKAWHSFEDALDRFAKGFPEFAKEMKLNELR